MYFFYTHKHSHFFLLTISSFKIFQPKLQIIQCRVSCIMPVSSWIYSAYCSFFTAQVPDPPEFGIPWHMSYRPFSLGSELLWPVLGWALKVVFQAAFPLINKRNMCHLLTTSSCLHVSCFSVCNIIDIQLWYNNFLCA